ncbi:tyrosine-type recombinase/integrase [Microbacterium sp. P05]|uniref:tyrosine-type recombinase/integrase n=1 Tax=Microbacterium sp. P05 TaxID=3366948 RepID=UPI003744C88D
MEKAVRLASGNWRQRVTDPHTGKRHSVTAPGPTDRKVKKAAALKLAELVAEQGMKKKKKKEIEATRTRFDLFAEAHLATRRPGEPGGYKISSYRKRLGHVATLNSTFGDQFIEEITPNQIRDWWNAHSSTPAQRHTLYWWMHQVFEVALDDELIQRNPCRIRNASDNGAKDRPTFEDDDVEKIHAAAESQQMKAMIAVLRGTALRIGELVALDWEDLDLLESKIPVTKHWTPFGILPGTKTGEKHTRTIAMPRWVQDALESLLEGTDGEGPIFRHSRNGRLSVDGAERRFEVIREKAGLPEMHLHDLRHTALTAYARQPEVTLKDLMEFGGHLSVAVAMRYQHASKERAEKHAATSMVPFWVKA